MLSRGIKAGQRPQGANEEPTKKEAATAPANTRTGQSTPALTPSQPINASSPPSQPINAGPHPSWSINASPPPLPAKYVHVLTLPSTSR